MAHRRATVPRGPARANAIGAVGGRSVARRGAACAALLLALAILPAAAQQGGRVGGTVVDAQTLKPLSGAQVVVEGTGIGALSDASGRFVLTGVAGRRVTLRVVMIGYKDMREDADVGAMDVRLALSPAAVSLNEIIVTGTPGGTQARAIGNSVSKVAVSDVEAVAPPADVQSVLSSHVPGVQITRFSGQIGVGGVTRIRGAASMSLSNEPLIYVDGVRVDNAAQAGSGGTGSTIGFWGADKPSRINDIDPEDIQSIEVIKGPAAATLYGTEASNGVIQIITKHGQSGAPRFNFDVQQGANYLGHPDKVFPLAYSKDPSTGQPVGFSVIDNDIKTGHGSPFSTGHAQVYGADMSGGTDQLHYYSSLRYDGEGGMVDYNWQHKLNSRASLTYAKGDKLSVTADLGLTRSKTRSASATQPITTLIIWAIGQPVADTKYRGYLGNVPEDYEPVEGYENLNRATGSVKIELSPWKWMHHRLTIGEDLGDSRFSTYFPRDPAGSGGPWGSQSLGEKDVKDVRNTFLSLDYSGTISLDVSPTLNFSTSGGAQYYEKQAQTDIATGTVFPVPGVSTVSAAATRFGDEAFVENKTFGLFVQEQMGWRNKLFLTGAVRGDDNSAFGKNYKFVVYPKFSGTWVLSEEKFFRVPWINTLKLRAAWGRAGEQPDVFAAARLYAPATGNGGISTVTPLNVGNADLKPEVNSELEAGFDSNLFDQRLSLQVTYYSQQNTGAIVQQPALPSMGFPGTQFVNVGKVVNSGLEIGANGDVLRGSKLDWNLGLTFSTNHNEVKDLGGITPGAYGITGMQQQVVGYPLASIFALKVVSAQMGADGKPTNMMCEGGDPVTGGGPPVPCSQAGTAYWGRPTPAWTGSANTTLTLFRNLRLYGQVDFTGGYWRIDGDLAASHLFFNNSKAAILRNDPILESYRALGQIWQAGIHKAGYAKLAVVSATYTLPGHLAERFGAHRASLTLSGQNLSTLWEAQPGTFGRKQVEPEISRGSLDAYNQEQWPQLVRLLAALRVSF